jgi:enterochelin esterase-like enzyme
MGQATPPVDGAVHPAAPLWHREAYITQAGRDLRLDLIRGLCVVIMIIDHVAGESPLYLVTGGNRFLTSAAEGFILTSGLTAGLVYRGLVERQGPVAAARKAFRRAGSLYLLAVGLALLIAPVSELYHLPWAQQIDFRRPVEFVVSVLTLHRTYYLADVMVLYALLLMLLPAALLLLHGGRARMVLAASGALWLLHQFFPDAATVTWPIDGNYLFLFSSWQLLFFVPLVLAYRYDRLPRLSRRGQYGLLFLAGLGVVLLLAVRELMNLPVSRVPQSWLVFGDWDTMRLFTEEQVFGKAHLRPGRVLATGVMAAFVFLALTRGWRLLGRLLGALLLPLGQNALYAFTLHAILSVAMPLALVLTGTPSDIPALNAAIQVGAVAVIWAGSRRKLLAPTQRTRRAWQASPLIMALVALVVMPRLPFMPVGPVAIPVSEAVLARARAYGTPVTSLEQAMFARAAAVTLAPTPGTPAVAAAAPATATAPPTPAPPELAVESVTRAPSATPATRTRAETATPAPDLTRTVTPAMEITPVPEISTDDPDQLPPLPPDGSLLQSEYVGPLSGSAYALGFYSDLLQREMAYWVYLPPGYVETASRYPVLYALHGGGGGLEEWAAYGLLDAADIAFREGSLRPFIIVLPQGDKSFWTNWANDSLRWGDYLAYEVVWQIDSAFATLRSPAARAVGGNSMGGWGALYQGLTHPDIFGVVVANSPSLYPDDGSLRFLGEGEEFASKEPLSLSLSAPNATALRIWLDVGEEDPWLERTRQLQDNLQARQIQHDWRLYPGIHGPEYWVQHVPDYLAFCGRTLRWQ